MRTIKLIVVAGARPNFMKVQPLIKCVQRYNEHRKPDDQALNLLLVHTGQHYDANMSDVFFRELGIRQPDINLGVGSGSHAVQTANIMIGFEGVCKEQNPDWVIVVGDVNSTMACALVCSKMGIRIAHIEAGLRSFDRTMPEEINRVVTDALADLLLTPSQDADENLLREGAPRERIKLVGNIMIDSLVDNLPRARACGVLSQLRLEPRGFIYVTLHRPANVDSRANLSMIMAALRRLAHRLPVVYPIHPRTHKMLSEHGLEFHSEDRFLLLQPLGYHASLCLAENARVVVTDSGGLQEETTFLRTPCLTLRENTERPITISLGSNRLTSKDNLIEDVECILTGPDEMGTIPPYWDGRTAERILDQLIAYSAG